MGAQSLRRIAQRDKIVLLIPARTDTSYFHDYVYGKAEIRFLRGRLRFEDEDGNRYPPAPFPSMLVIYNGEHYVELNRFYNMGRTAHTAAKGW